MLESSGFSTFYQDAPNQCLFEVKTKDPRLNLGLVSFIPTFQLERDLDLSLDSNSNYATSRNEFEMDFSLPSHRFNDFVAPVNKLNVLPDKIDFSELLSFQSETSSIPSEKTSIKEFCKPADVMQMQTQLISMPEESTEITADDAIETQGVQLKSGLFSESFKSNSHCFIADAMRTGVKFRSQDDSKSNYSVDFVENIKKEMQEDCTKGSILDSYYKANTNGNKKLSTLSETISNKKLEEAEKTPLKENSLSVIRSFSANKLKDPMQEQLVKKLECNKEISRKDSRIIVEANKIRDIGVQIFRKPTRLFTFDNLKEWKKKGEGQIEIWKLQQSDEEIYYILLWDKCTQKLLIHMRLDSKWGIDYLTNSTNSCRWSHYNYAHGPEGVRECFACRFRDSDVAAQFISAVGKCTANSNLH